MQRVNEIDMNIKFTLEIETEKVLPYLDTELKNIDERKIERIITESISDQITPSLMSATLFLNIFAAIDFI